MTSKRKVRVWTSLYFPPQRAKELHGADDIPSVRSVRSGQAGRHRQQQSAAEYDDDDDYDDVTHLSAPTRTMATTTEPSLASPRRAEPAGRPAENDFSPPWITPDHWLPTVSSILATHSKRASSHVSKKEGRKDGRTDRRKEGRKEGRGETR